MEKKRLIFFGTALGALAVAGAIVIHFASFAYSPARSDLGKEDQPAIIEIQKGLSPRELTRQLVGKGIVADADLFLWLGRLGKFWPKVKAGEYQVSPGMTPIEVFSTITSGISIAHPVTIREGQNMYEVAAEIAAKGLASREKILELCRSQKFIGSLGLWQIQSETLEGYLFPETYFFNKSMTPEEMLTQMVKKFKSLWTDEMTARAQELGLTPHQAITLASIIEKETGAAQERPLISSVFHNRLRKKMRLQSDPTTIYGIWERYQGNLHRSDLLTANPFNTYYIPALPVGPIANPGKEAIQAALFPAVSEFLFFVSHNDGTHEFTRSLDEHNSAVRRFQLDPKAREGKSWRDLSKKTAAKPR